MPNSMADHSNHMIASMAHEVYARGKIQRASVGTLRRIADGYHLIEKDILIEQNRNERKEQETKEFNLRLLAEINGRWESSREEGSDTDKKTLVDYDEWRAIGGCLYREEIVRNMLDGEMSDENLT